MGAAYDPPDSLQESYPQEPNRGCVAKLEYRIAGWAGWWTKLQGATSARSPPWYSTCGPIRSRGSPTRSSWNSNVPVKSVSSACRASGPSGAPSTSSLSDFGYAGYGKPVSAWQGMEEFVVVFEADKSGRQGVVLIDNIRFEP